MHTRDEMSGFAAAARQNRQQQQHTKTNSLQQQEHQQNLGITQQAKKYLTHTV
jgi:C1A family cysteine protease